MYRKGAQDAKRAKVFTKLIREIVVAAKINTDPDSNPRLRSALAAARAANMPKDNIARAIKKAEGGEGADSYEEVRYEGYGSGGVAIIVDVLTDNRNRTAAEIRSAFNKFGGSMGETNSVSFMFDRLGEVSYPPESADADDMFEAALEAGAQDVESTDDGHTVITAMDDFSAVRDALEQRFGDAAGAGLTWRPQTTVAIDEGTAETVLKLIDTLNDNDDVQRVSANFEVDDAVLAKLTA